MFQSFKHNYHHQKLNMQFLTIILFVFIGCKAFAEDMFVRSLLNRREYAENVSRIVANIYGTDGFTTKSTSELVLYRTNGQEIDFTSFSPKAILIGPNYCGTVLFSTREEAEHFVAEASSYDYVLYAELDQSIHESTSVETIKLVNRDAEFHSWGARKMHFDALNSFSLQAGNNSASVAIIDSGVYSHPLLTSRIVYGGFDYVDQDYDPSNDGTGHGTHVAGIVADCTPNLSIHLFPIRVFDNSGNGRIANVINAIEEAIAAAVSVINLSLMSDSHSEALHYAIDDALSAGITVVAAAGNQGTDVSSMCPGHLCRNGFIVVGSAEEGGMISAYSNYGNGVDVFAYGSEILSCSRTGGYISQSGTSMAAPHISAAAAVMLTVHAGLSPPVVETRLKHILKELVPDLNGLVPVDTGIRMQTVFMVKGQRVPVPMVANPLTCNEPIVWQSSNEDVAMVHEGYLMAYAPGTCTLSLQCVGLTPQTMFITVCEGEWGMLSLHAEEIDASAFENDIQLRQIEFGPETQRLGEYCFHGCDQLAWVYLTENEILWIDEDAFDQDSKAVFVCKQGTKISEFIQHGKMQYILLPPD